MPLLEPRRERTSAPPAAEAQGGSHDEHIVLPAAPSPRARTLFAIGAAILGLFAVLFLAGLVPKLRRAHALREESAVASSAAPRVSAAKPRRAVATEAVSLPGSVEALRETTIYARTQGYVKRRLADIGDLVEDGQLLAELETPEVRQELLAAQGALAEAQGALGQAKSNLEFSRTSRERYKSLVPAGLASQQDLDQREASYAAAASALFSAEASVQSNQAKVKQLQELIGFARVTAPFAGTVTSRSVDVGALVTVGNGVGQALFKVAQMSTVRVFVSVPQSYAPLVRAGEPATVTVREYPGRSFAGKIMRAAGALDAASRTMLTEIEVPNDDRALLPGMYAQASLHVAGVPSTLLVPASALLLTPEGPKLAIVGDGRRVHLQKIEIEGDYGFDLGIAVGLGADDTVITNPGDRIAEGVVVDVVEPAKPAK
jgi:membrane fusion protein, multidrug efflux system